MTIRRSKSETSISLFPFLSVLACVIGTLTLMIASLALGNLVASSTAKIKQQHDRLQKDNRDARDEIARLKRLLSEALTLDGKLIKVREKHKYLEQAMKRSRKQEQDWTNMLGEAEELQKKINIMEHDLKRLQQTIKDRQKVLQALKKDMDNSSKETRIVLQPRGSGQGLTPHFVECTQDTLIIFSDLYKTQIRIKRTDDDDLRKFSNFLKRIQKRKKTTVIFLIRSNGVPAYEDAYSLAEELKVRNGKLPLPGQGEIDFSLVSKS